MKHMTRVNESTFDASNDRCVRILWTGGWDSTFRVLYSTLVDRKRVEPHYIIDTTRPSSIRELQAISDIKAMLRTSHKEAYARIAPLQITSANEIPEDPEISSAWKRLKERAFLGYQYDWLARYAKAKDVTDLELSVHIDDKLYSFLKGHIEQTSEGGYRLQRRVTGDESIFLRFEFPILDYSKTHMRDMARQHGFLEILEKTWFCHKPINGMPCGMCSPCVYAVEEGMRYRLPREAMFRYHTRRYRSAIRAPLLSMRKSLSEVKALRRVYDLLRYGSKS